MSGEGSDDVYGKLFGGDFDADEFTDEGTVCVDPDEEVEDEDVVGEVVNAAVERGWSLIRRDVATRVSGVSLDEEAEIEASVRIAFGNSWVRSQFDKITTERLKRGGNT
jgi:hypothetical protein